MKKPAHSKDKKTLNQALKILPKELFYKNRIKVFRSILITIGTTASGLFLSYFSITLLPHVVGIPIACLIGWFITGTALTGGFDLAHDAAHGSLFESPRMNTIVGSFFSALVGWPFEIWKYAHNLHHKYANNVGKEIAWEPYTPERLNKLPPFFLFTYTKIRSSYYFTWLGGFFHLYEQLYKFKRKSSRFPKSHRSKIRNSILVTSLIFIVFGAFIWMIDPLLFLAGFIIPLARYYWWLSIFTLLHHTTPFRQFLTEEEWKKDKFKAQIEGTVNVLYGSYVDLLTHNIAWHVPHHLSTAIPHYNLKKATKILQEHYPDAILEVPYSLKYLKQVVDHCQMITSLEDTQWQRFPK